MTDLRTREAEPGGRVWRLGVLDESEIVVAGLGALLARPIGAVGDPARIEVVELAPGEALGEDVDVVLVDPRHLFGPGSAFAGRLDERGALVVAFAWQLERDQTSALLARGAAGCLTKRLSASELVEALAAIRRGETVVRSRSSVGTDPTGRDREQLTVREREILTLIAEGLTNQEIADQLYLSINSVKTFIRTAYRKIGVATRSQAVAWQLRWTG